MSKFSDSTFYLAPSGYRETILFPQKPLSSIGHLSVGRASSATRTNPAGQIEEVCYNLFRYSEDFSNAVWNKALGTFTTNTTVAPDGNLTADTFTKTSGVNTVSTVDSTLTTYSNTGVHTLSVYIKPIVGNSILLRLDSSGNTANASFNFTTKTFLNSGANIISSSYQELPNGWFRLSITGNVLNTSWISSICNLFSNPTNDAMAIWGAQLVQGNLPKDYLYTSDRLNFPRVDYSAGSASFLLEPQRTNLALYSEEFNNAAWTKNLAGIGSVPIVTANAGISPSGTTTADRIQFALNGGTTASDVSDIRQLIVVTSASYTLSFWVKSFDETSSYQMLVRDVNGFVNRILVTGVWERYTITPTYSSGNATIGFGIRGGQTPTNPNTADILVWGAQFEVGAYPTTYIPTTTASATRVADSFSRNNIYTNGLITSSGGTWFVELRGNLSLTRDASDVGLFIGNSSNGVSGDVLAIRNNGTGRLAITKRISGTQTGLYDTTTDTTKIAIKWNGSTADVFVNGVKQVSATSFTATNMEFLNGTGADVTKFIQQMALWNTPLSDSQCIELTGVAYTTPAQAYGSLNLVSESPDCLYTSVNTINRI